MVEHLSRTPTTRRRVRSTPGRRCRVLTLVAALVLSLSACDVWDQAGRLPDASRFNPEEVAITPSNVASLSDAWSSRLVFDAHGCGSAACSRLAGVDFGDQQPLQAAVAGGRVAVVAVGLDAATLRVLVPGS